MAAPTLQEFMPAARQANPGMPDSELESYWSKTYGAAPGNAVSGPPLDVFLDKAKPLNPGVSDSELTDYWKRNYGERGAPEQQRGLGAEVGSQLWAGASIDLPQMIGQAMEWMSVPAPNGSESDLHRWGKDLADWATQRQAEHPELQPQVEGRGIIGKALSYGSRAMVPSLATVLPALAAAPLDVPLAVAAAGGVGAFGLFGGSQAQQSYEAVKQAGGTESEAKKAGWINFLIEGGGETLGTYAGAKLFGVGAKALARAGESEVQAAIRGATDAKIWQPFLKQLPETIATEAGTEFGQNYGEAKVEQAYGVQGHQPVQEGIQGGLAALGMTALLAPFGLGGFATRARQNGKVATALQDPQTPDAFRVAAAKKVFGDIAQVNPEAAHAWAVNSSIAIANKAPISLDESTAGVKLSDARQQSKDAVAPARVMAAPTVDDAVKAAEQELNAPVELPPEIMSAIAAEAGNAPSMQHEVEKRQQVEVAFGQKGRQDQAAKDAELQAMLDERRNIDAEAAIAQSNLPEPGTQVPNQGTPKTAMQIAWEKAVLKRMEALQQERANAIQEQGAGAVDVRQPPGNGEGVGGQNAVAEQPTGESQPQAQAPGADLAGNEPVATAHEFSSTQAPLTGQIGQQVNAAAKQIIAPQDIHPVEGLEDYPHITVKYGLHGDNLAGVQQALKDEPPVKAKITGIEIFSPKDKDYDVVVARVDSPDLARLNAKLKEALPNTETHPTYKPHITLGYVNKGAGEKYANAKTGLEGKTITLNTVEFSDRNGNLTPINLEGQPQEQPAVQAPVEAKAAQAPVAQPAARVTINGQNPAEMTVAQLQHAAEHAPYFDQKDAAKAELKSRDKKGETILGRTVDQLTDAELNVAAQKAKNANARQAAQTELARRNAADTEFADKLKNPDTAAALKSFANEAGWAERGGHMVRNGEKVTRTKWIPKAEWWPGRPVQENEQFYRNAVAKALAGEKLSRKQKDAVRFLVGMAEDQRAGTEMPSEATPEAAQVAHELADQMPVPNGWLTMTKEQQDEELDAKFGADTSEAAQGAAAPRAQAGEAVRAPEVGQAAKATPALELKGQTEAQIKAEEAARAKEAEAKRQKENAPAPEEFKLAGSNRPADVAAANGQQDLLAPHPLTAAADALRKAADTIEAAAKPAPKSGEITDFGEKIGGARKDVWSSFKDKMQEAEGVDIKAEPLSKSWPAPDYQALLDSGADPWIVGFIHAARDEIPTKPHASWKVSRWAESVKMLRDMASSLVNGEITRARVEGLLMEHASKSRGMLDLQGRAELYQLVGHEKSLAGVRIARGEYGIFEGKEYNPPKVIWSIEKKAAATAFSNWPRMLAMGDTKQAAMDNFKEKYNSLAITQPANKTISFEIYSKRGEDGYYIGKKIGRNPTLLEGPFKTVKEARAHKDEHHDDLVKKLERYKEIPNERRETNEPRVGEDMRNGQDVTPQMFSDAFGFRGVEFGNWVEQGKRQKDLNDAYDALMDMAAVLNVPPKALSLNGELGLAFGARGTGGKRAAAAHYESDRVVINLTKKEGAGSIGHEWWHALDNYFSRMRGAKSAYMTWNNGPAPELRPEMIDAFRKVVQAIRETAIKARSSKLDARRSKDYWTSGHEMSARAYESYLISKLQDQNASNDYLANIVDEATWKAAEKLGFELDDSYPYPTAGEIPTIRAAFDHFFSTIETKQTDKGLAFNQRGSAYNPNQLDLIYDDAKTRPGTTQEQRSEGIAALKALFSRDRRAGASLLGSALWRDFQERKGAELIGQTARDAEDVAVLAQILRDPRFETLRFFFTKKWEIVGHTAQTSRLPGSVAFISVLSPPGDRTNREDAAFNNRIAELKATMDRLGADGYYMLHNHPSGTAAPSVADGMLTRNVANALPGFKGHVVIDHDQYGTLDANGEPSIHHAALSKRAERELPHDALGMKVDSPLALGRVAKAMQSRTGYATLISTSAQGNVMALAEVPEHLLADKRGTAAMKAIGRARRFARMTGSDRTFIVSDNTHGFDHLIKAGVVTDVISTSGAEHTSRRARDSKGELLSAGKTSRAAVFSVEQPSIANSATYGDAKDGLAKKASDFVHDYLSGFDKLSWWNKTVGTPFHIALTNAEFKPFYDEGQAFLNDVSRFANESADLAQDLLPRVEGYRDFTKQSPKKADVQAATDALYSGTLWGNGSPMEGRIWTDDELKSGRAQDGNVSIKAFEPLNDKQIALYRQSLAAVGQSLDGIGKSLIHRSARPFDIGFERDMSLEDAAQSVRDQIDSRREDLSLALDAAKSDKNDAKAERIQKEIDQLDGLKAQVDDLEAKTNGLKEHGYMPAMRFGRYALHVTKDGNQLYFGMYESKIQALRAERELTKVYPGADIERGIISKEQYKLFQGLSLDALEAFADYMTDENGNPLSKDPLVQGFLKAAVAERSVLKRHIHRKGLAGFSTDLPRVLASFVTAGARATSSNYHSGEMVRIANNIKAGDVKDYAAKMFRYMMDPQEEAHALRGFLFAQYLGGSVASGLVNMTQPFMLTAPYLTQYTSAADAYAKISAAAAENPAKLSGKISDAYKRAKDEGVIAPQEIHQLRAETQGGVTGRNLALRKLSFAWGSIFSLAEQFNRKTTFLAAYRIAEKNGVKDPYAFAVKAVAETQFTYNRGNRPAWFRGPVGATVGTFKVFSISSLELASRLFRMKNKKPLATLALVLLAAAGLEGLPFAEDIEDVIDTIGQWLGFATNTKKRLRQWATGMLGPTFGNIMLHGMSGVPFMPIDVSRRLGYENLIPGTSLLKPSEQNKGRDVLELIGPAGQFVPTEDTMMGRAIDRLLNGDLLGIVKSGIFSRAAANLAQGTEMASRGEYRDIKGRKVMEQSPAQAAFKAIGLQPAELARQQDLMGELRQDIGIQQRTESEIAEAWARGLADNDQKMVSGAVNRLMRWNRENPDLPVRITRGQILSRVRQLKSSKLDRFLKSAPPEIRGGVRQALQ